MLVDDDGGGDAVAALFAVLFDFALVSQSRRMIYVLPSTGFYGTAKTVREVSGK